MHPRNAGPPTEAVSQRESKCFHAVSCMVDPHGNMMKLLLAESDFCVDSSGLLEVLEQ